MGAGGLAIHFHATQKGAVGDAGGAKEDPVALGEVLRQIHAVEEFLVALRDQHALLEAVLRPDFRLQATAQASEPGGGKHAFRSAADPDVEIHVALGKRGSDGRGDIAIGDHP